MPAAQTKLGYKCSIVFVNVNTTCNIVMSTPLSAGGAPGARRAGSAVSGGSIEVLFLALSSFAFEWCTR